LAVIGLVLFAIVSYGAFKRTHERGLANDRYLWWSSIRLDSDPRNKHSRAGNALHAACENSLMRHQ
jgi:hypothetical protein